MNWNNPSMPFSRVANRKTLHLRQDQMLLTDIVNFAPGAVSLKLQAWTDRYEVWVQVRSDLSLAVDQALTRENITIA